MDKHPMHRTLILGIGNLLLSDDGVGIHAVRLLQEKANIDESVQVIDGGTCGLDLLQYLEGIDRLIVLDAARPNGSPGKLSRITGDKVPAYLSIKTSPHEIGLPELLFAAKLTDIYPPKVVILCVEAGSLESGIQLSQPVNTIMGEFIDRIIEELNHKGQSERAGISIKM
jgi:hydrogenase maturation protease